jgi:hypothetical protein
MPVYTCELCQKEFNQKGDLTKHQAKKTPCITMQQIQGMTKAKEDTNDIKDILKGIFHKCLDILRSEGLTGDKALRNLSYILILKLSLLFILRHAGFMARRVKFLILPRQDKGSCHVETLVSVFYSCSLCMIQPFIC